MKTHYKIDGTMRSACGKSRKGVPTGTGVDCQACINTKVFKIHVGESDDMKSRVKELSETLEKAGARVRASLDRAADIRRKRKGFCSNCGKKIRTMVYNGTDHCSELCRKALHDA